MDREKLGFWVVVDKDGEVPILQINKEFAEDKCREWDSMCPHVAPHRAVYLQEVEGPEE